MKGVTGLLLLAALFFAGAFVASRLAGETRQLAAAHEQLAVLSRLGVGLNEFVLHPLVGEHIQTVADNRGGGIAGANAGDLPQQPGTFLRPFLERAGFLGNTISRRAAPLRPVLGLELQRNQTESDRNLEHDERRVCLG